MTSLPISKELFKVLGKRPTRDVWANAEYRTTGFNGEGELFVSSMYRLFSGLEKEDVVRGQQHSSYEVIAAYSVTELTDILDTLEKNDIYWNLGNFAPSPDPFPGTPPHKDIKYVCSLWGDIEDHKVTSAGTPADALGKMVIRLHKKGVL